MKATDSAAVAAVSLGVVETFRLYRETAPSLEELRRSDPGDYVMRQLVLDADMLGLIVAAAVGGGAAFLSRQFYPLVLTFGSLLLISLYYRSVLNSSNERMVGND